MFHLQVVFFRVEPTGFEPLTSAVQRRYKLSGCVLARAWLKHAESASLKQGMPWAVSGSVLVRLLQ